MSTGTLLPPDPSSPIMCRRLRKKLQRVMPMPPAIKEFVRVKVIKLFQATPDDKEANFVKEVVFRISEGRPIIGSEHPVIVEMFAQPIVSMLCCFVYMLIMSYRC